MVEVLQTPNKALFFNPLRIKIYSVTLHEIEPMLMKRAKCEKLISTRVLVIDSNRN